MFRRFEGAPEFEITFFISPKSISNVLWPIKLRKKEENFTFSISVKGEMGKAAIKWTFFIDNKKSLAAFNKTLFTLFRRKLEGEYYEIWVKLTWSFFKVIHSNAFHSSLDRLIFPLIRQFFFFFPACFSGFNELCAISFCDLSQDNEGCFGYFNTYKMFSFHVVLLSSKLSASASKWYMTHHYVFLLPVLFKVRQMWVRKKP